jgi:hypothetical protein
MLPPYPGVFGFAMRRAAYRGPLQFSTVPMAPAAGEASSGCSPLSFASRARAKRVLESVFARNDTVEIGRVRKVGEGLSHEVFAAYVEVRPDAGGRSGAYAVYLPSRRADPERRADPMREAALLDRVAAETQAIRVPDVTAVVSTDGGDVMVRRYFEGIPLDLRAGHQHGVRPWEATMLGDPAYDLAIITRGVRRPFQIERGLERLLDAYAASSPRRITASAVHLHELCLAGRWYREALEGASAREPADQALRRVEQVLGRARAAAARERCSTMR